MRILYDGWPLIYHPDGAAALHLSTLLTLTPEGIEPVLALPTESSPEGFLEGIHLAHQASQDLRAWQQRSLPALAAAHQAQAIHSTQSAASLFGRVPTIISPSGYGALEPSQAGMVGRLGQALGRGGLARAQVLFPADMDAPRLPGELLPIAPIANPAFSGTHTHAPEELELPQSYLLYHGPSHPGTLLQLLDSWTWAAASIGEMYPLVLLGLSEAAKRFVEQKAPEFHVEEYVHLLPRVHPAHLAAIYQGASAVLHPAPPSLWGGAARHALAADLPLAAYADPAIERLVGAAAYLVEPGNLRAFGAATITVVVDDKVRADLISAAHKLRSQWDAAQFKSDLGEIYAQLA
jgi:glycosyltransferase involved in cell wall biosynthesis